MHFATLVATLRSPDVVHGHPGMLRGYLAGRHPENVLLHQHCGDAAEHRFAYLYPRVQYRLRHGIPRLLGIADGVTVVPEATRDLTSVELSGRHYPITAVEEQPGGAELEETDRPLFYRFVSPWLALSQKNYAHYQISKGAQRLDLLQRILIGNILSMCKSLGITITERLRAVTALRPVHVSVKNQRMLGFLGTFSVNFRLCPGFGLGHLVSIGFGEVAGC
jgi:hypothetical protein